MTTYDVPNGLTGFYRLPRTDVLVPVHVTGLRSAYGREELLVSPIGGEGELWARRASVTITEDED